MHGKYCARLFSKTILVHHTRLGFTRFNEVKSSFGSAHTHLLHRAAGTASPLSLLACSRQQWLASWMKPPTPVVSDADWYRLEPLCTVYTSKTRVIFSPHVEGVISATWTKANRPPPPGPASSTCRWLSRRASFSIS